MLGVGRRDRKEIGLGSQRGKRERERERERERTRGKAKKKRRLNKRVWKEK